MAKKRTWHVHVDKRGRSKVTYSLANRDAGPGPTVDADLVGKCLAVRKGVTGFTSDTWGVDHAPTGTVAVHAKKKADAISAAEYIKKQLGRNQDAFCAMTAKNLESKRWLKTSWWAKFLKSRKGRQLEQYAASMHYYTHAEALAFAKNVK